MLTLKVNPYLTGLFLNNPNWDSDHYSISLALNNGAIDGMLGTIPFDLNIYGDSFKACWLVN